MAGPDTQPAPAGGDNAASAASLIPQSDELAAAAALERFIDWTDDPPPESDDGAAEESGGDEPQDAGTSESASTGEDEGQPEPQAETPAAIDPPASWSAEDKALFAKLPPDAQQVVARRESERDRVIQQRTQEVAEQRKAVEAERTAIESQRKQYSDNLQSLLLLAVPEIEQYAKIDWQKLATENPAEAVRLDLARRQLSDRLGRVQQEVQRVQQEAAETQKKRQAEFLAEQRAKLVERIPEFGDEAKAATLTKDLGSYLTAAGFSPEEIGMVADHRLIAVAREAMLYRQAEAARKTAETKRAAPQPAPVQRPGAAAAPEDGQQRRAQELTRRLQRTGDIRAAAALIEMGL